MSREITHVVDCGGVDVFFLFLCFSDIALSHLEKEKSLSFIRAWEESEKAKAENK